MWIGHNIASLLCYPFITVMRRLQCQSELPGMIPERYRNVTHCFKLMMIEEGVKGFYRGYAMNFIISNSTLMLGIISNIYYSKYYYLAKVD